MLEQLEKTFDLQEFSKLENSRKVRELLGRVRALEKQTWDKADAKEDMGSQKP